MISVFYASHIAIAFHGECSDISNGVYIGDARFEERISLQNYNQMGRSMSNNGNPKRGNQS